MAKLEPNNIAEDHSKILPLVLLLSNKLDDQTDLITSINRG